MNQISYYRGLIIVKPYGTFIKKKEKTIIVKSKLVSTIINHDLLLIEDKIGLGIIQLGKPIRINLKQFKKMYKYHLIPEKDRIEWWSRYHILYAYPIIKNKIFKKPLLLNYSMGAQITIKPENIIYKKILVGMSGYDYKQMYPSGINDRLTYYQNYLNSVEINMTFYRFPTEKTLLKLLKYHLCYTIKVNRYITHVKRLNEVDEYWNQFYQSLSSLHNRIICFLFQFSSNFLYNSTNMYRLKKIIKHLNPKHRYAFEFRDSSWFNNDEVNKLFLIHNLIQVIVNVSDGWTNLSPGFNPPLNKYKPTSDMLYIRMHGTQNKYVGSYTPKELHKIFNFIAEKSVDKSLVYFNNTDHDSDAFRNAVSLKNKFNDYNLNFVCK